MDVNYRIIPQIHPHTRNWTVRVTITEDIPVMKCLNGAPLKRYVLTDDEGNQIAASAYGLTVAAVTPNLKLYKVFDISNAEVRMVELIYKVLDSPLEWHIQQPTLMQEVHNVKPNLRYFLDGLTPFGLIMNSSVKNIKSIDVMGVVIEAAEFMLIHKEEG